MAENRNYQKHFSESILYRTFLKICPVGLRADTKSETERQVDRHGLDMRFSSLVFK
jgi:hypothetical protein